MKINKLSIKTNLEERSFSLNDNIINFTFYDKSSTPLGLINFLCKCLTKPSILSSIWLHQEPGEVIFIIFKNKLYFYDDNFYSSEELLWLNLNQPKEFKDKKLEVDLNLQKVCQDFLNKYTIGINLPVKKFSKIIYNEFNKDEWADTMGDLSKNFTNSMKKLELLVQYNI